MSLHPFATLATVQVTKGCLAMVLSKLIPLAIALAILAAGAITAFKLPRPAAAHHAAEPLDPVLLHMQLQRSRDEMALP